MIKIDTLYVDLDGVLVNFELGIYDIVKEYVGHKRDTIDDTTAGLLDEMYKKLGDHGHEKAGELLGHKAYKEAIRKIVGLEPEWWTHLEWMPDGKALWDAIKKYNPIVLSSPLNKTYWQEKYTWVERELGPNVKVLIEDDKEIHATKSALLIDDRPHHSDFEQYGGHTINHSSTKTTLQELKKYDLSALENTNPAYERKIMNFDGFVINENNKKA